MALMDACSGLNAGMPVLRCVSQQTGYLPGWAFIIVYFLILYSSSSKNDGRNAPRLMAASANTSIVAALMSLGGLLPDKIWIVFFIIGVGGLGALTMQSKN